MLLKVHDMPLLEHSSSLNLHTVVMLEERIHSEVTDLPLDQVNSQTEQLTGSHVLDPEGP